MENFADTTTDIILKNHHTWGCTLYVLDEILQIIIYGLPRWEYLWREIIYLRHSPFNEVSLALVLNPETFHVSPQFHVLFDDEFSTAPFMREGTIPPNLKYLVQHISESGTAENLELKDNWFISDPD